MGSTMVHICLQTAEAPSEQDEHTMGERWVCSCGDNFVYREGFNRGGYSSLEWWLAPPLPKQRRARRGLLFGPRKGS